MSREPTLWWDFDPKTDRRQYVEHVLDAYSRTPTCAGKVRREDRRLAHRLFDQRIPAILLEAALILATARRLYRPEDAEPLTPIRSLHYFLPVIEEIRQQAIDPEYLDHLAYKVRYADRLVPRAHQIARTSPFRQYHEPT